MQWSVTLSHCGVTTVTFDLLNSVGADAAAVDVVYRPEQDREEEVLQEDSTESDSDEFDM